MFFTVQRLTRKRRPTDEPSPFAPVAAQATGFDDLFGCDYMDNAEFERGAIPEAFRQMSGLVLTVKPVQIKRYGTTRTVYFVASDDPAAYRECSDRDDTPVTTFEQLIHQFRIWSSRPEPRSREITYFDTAFDNGPTTAEYRKRIVAWWSLDDNVAWTLDETIAQELLGAFSQTRVAQA
jgi:hypothetical protein